MATLDNSQFFKISADGKEIKGYSEDEDYKDYIEGYSLGEVVANKTTSGHYFNGISARVLVKNSEVASLYGKYLDKNNHMFEVTIVHRTKFSNKPFEHKKCIYGNCTIQSLAIVAMEDGQTYYDIYFTFENVSVEFTIPKSDSSGKLSMAKNGPFAYDAAKQVLK